MELYHLKTFVTVAEEGHLTRAADRLFTSQPAISAHIKSLEEELGITLFNRTPRGMLLTTEGEQLLPRAQQTLSAAVEFVQFAKGMQDELVGRIRVGLNNDAEFLRLPQIQHYLTSQYPRLELNFLAGMTETNIKNIRVGRMDGAFISGQCHDPQMEVMPLGEVELCVTAPIDWRDRISPASIEVLAKQPWVYTSPDCAYFGAIQSLFDIHCCKPEKVLVSDQEDALHSMVKAGVGIGIVRKDIAEKGEQDGYFYIPPTDIPSVSLNFIYLKKRANDPIIAAFMNALNTCWDIDSSKAQHQEAS
jgi:DNA-binding transcriptional LysR family regulator